MNGEIQKFATKLIGAGCIEKGPGEWGTEGSYNKDFHKDISGVVQTGWDFSKQST